MVTQIKILLIAFISAILMSLGLVIAEVTDAREVIDLLDIFGNWNPRLILVFPSAILIYASTYRFIKKMKKPLLTSKFILPVKQSIDKRLIIGAAIFGLGWGITGLSPATALVNLGSANQDLIIFVISMIVGMKLFQLLDKKYNKNS